MKTAKEHIRAALKTIMSEGEANACQIYKNWEGWHYCKFGKTPTPIGNNLPEALQFFADVIDSRKEN